MADFHTKTFLKHDDYMSPFSMWDNIKHIIPDNKVLWESAYGDGKSGDYLKELGFNVIHTGIDYFEDEPTDWDIQITNPPFSRKKEWFTRAKELNKPFIIVSPASVITTQYMRQLFSKCDDKLQIIIPRKRIQFTKMIDGEIPDGWGVTHGNRCNFDCFYYCWKINLPSDIIWLD